MTIPMATLRVLGARPAPAARSVPPAHLNHGPPIYLDGIKICPDCQRAERCVCRGWIIDDIEPEDGGFAAISAHQHTPQHIAYHEARHELDCPFHADPKQ